MNRLEARLLKGLTDMMTSVPASRLAKVSDPRSHADALTLTAAKRAAAVSGGAAAVPGIGTTLSLVPDLLATFAIQRRLVADIAALYGHSPALTPEVMTSLLFGEFAPAAVRGLVTPGANPSSPSWGRVPGLLLRRALRRVAWAIARRLLGRAVERLIPIVGAAGAGYGTYRATLGVGRASIAFFEQRRLAPPGEKPALPAMPDGELPPPGVPEEEIGHGELPRV